ncbi:MAG: prepilin peptidase [Pseudomonadota bacterium]
MALLVAPLFPFALASLLGTLAWTDWRTKTVPDGLTLSLVATGLANSWIAGETFGATATLSLGLISLGLFQERVFAERGWFGSGDYFLFAGAIAWTGLLAIADLLLLTSIFLGAHAIFARSTTIAMAPSLAAATLILFFGAPY